jgi:hypothetical protein
MLKGVSPLSGLATLRDAQSHRVSSWDRTGRNHDAIAIEPGETATLADVEDAGCIRHIWFTISCEDRLYLRKLVLRIYWDGEPTPSVEVPVGDFFGVGHAVAAHYVSLPLNMTTGPGRKLHAGMNSFFPMPFARRARVTIENPCQVPVGAFYYYIDYESYPELPGDQARFHAQWRCEHPCHAVQHPEPEPLNGVNLTGAENYVLLEAQGRGHFVGCLLNVDNWNAFHQPYTWFGEGDDMIFIDADTWPPSLHGTGTEDYFCEAWGFPSGAYAGPYHGISLAGDAGEWSGQWSLYRFHIEDPIHFRERIRVTIEHGHANDQGNDYSSVAYWYQTEPHGPFPALPEVEQRRPRRHNM